MTVTYSTKELQSITGLDEKTIIGYLTSGILPAIKVINYAKSQSDKYKINPEAIWKLITR